MAHFLLLERWRGALGSVQGVWRNADFLLFRVLFTFVKLLMTVVVVVVWFRLVWFGFPLQFLGLCFAAIGKNWSGSCLRPHTSSPLTRERGARFMWMGIHAIEKFIPEIEFNNVHLKLHNHKSHTQKYKKPIVCMSKRALLRAHSASLKRKRRRASTRG